MDQAERELLATTIRDALAPADVDADGMLAELGWLEVLDTEPSDAIAIVFTALGATGHMASILDDVFVSALGLTPRADLAVLLPDYGTWHPTDSDGLITARAGVAGELLIGRGIGSGARLSTVPMSTCASRPIRGIDPDAGFAVAQVPRNNAAATTITLEVWDAAIALGRRAVAHQIIGACRTMLDLARTHALERVQFGRPIVRFQAVRHRLAEALVAIEAAEGALAAAADEPDPMTAALAKAVAGRSARTVAAHCQQVLAGIGFTTDHPFHRFLKRTMLLEGVFGSADDIVLDIGRELLRTRRVPTLVEL